MQANALPVPLMNANVKKWFMEGMETFLSTQSILYTTLANVRKLESKEDLISTFTGGSYYAQHGVFEQAKMYEPGKGWQMGFDPLIYKSSFRVPDELKQYGAPVTSKIAKWATNLGANAIQTLDLLWVNLLNNAFNAAYLTYDGLPLCSISHPLRNASGVFANTPAAGSALDENSLADGLTYFMDMPTDDGMSMSLTPRYLVVSVKRRLLAEQLVQSRSPLAAPNENVKSRVYDSLQVVSSPKLTAVNAWFILAEPSELEGTGHGLDLWFSPSGMPRTNIVRNENPEYDQYIGQFQTVATVTKVRGVYGNPGV